MIKFFKFFLSKLFLLNLGAIILVWIIIVFAEGSYLKSSTNFGEKIAVPSFYKIHIDDLDKFVEGKGILYNIQDSVYLDDWPKGTVCWQYPRPTDSTGMAVKSGRVIQLSVVPIHAQMLKMPKVTDMSKRMAESTLNSKGIRTKISYKPASYGPGFVLEQLYNGKQITPGTLIPKGSRIELVVAQGSNGEPSGLPNLVGLTISEAKERLSTLTLTLYPDCASCTSPEDFLTAVITNQSPNGGEGVMIAAGSTVTVWASKAE
jgi:beta-lactam-binding protein with PASTA domain